MGNAAVYLGVFSEESRESEKDPTRFPRLFSFSLSSSCPSERESERARSRQMRKIAVVGSRDRAATVKLNFVRFCLRGKVFPGPRAHLRAHFDARESSRLLIESPRPSYRNHCSLSAVRRSFVARASLSSRVFRSRLTLGLRVPVRNLRYLTRICIPMIAFTRSFIQN